VPEPLVSVVVPTRSRPERLARLLEGLRQQTLESQHFEVIVVADGAGPETRQLLTHWTATHGPELRVLSHSEPRGPAAARNTGWRAARAPLVAFTDDDCVPVPQWLEAGLEAARPDTIVQGITQPDPREPSGLLTRTVQVNSLGPQYETCNIFYPRRALEAVGGFDEGYGLTPGGEDTDLAWRAIAAGFPTVLAAEALVHHAVERVGPAGMLRIAARWTTPIRVFADHPAIRGMLYRGVFWNVWHYLMWRSVLALFGPRWMRQVVVTRHLLELQRRARRAGSGSWAIVFLLAYDVVECWAVARGAVRYRTFVL